MSKIWIYLIGVTFLYAPKLFFYELHIQNFLFFYVSVVTFFCLFVYSFTFFLVRVAMFSIEYIWMTIFWTSNEVNFYKSFWVHFKNCVDISKKNPIIRNPNGVITWKGVCVENLKGSGPKIVRFKRKVRGRRFNIKRMTLNSNWTNRISQKFRHARIRCPFLLGPMQ